MTIIFESGFWLIFGAVIYRQKLVDIRVPRLLGKTLYWVGVPLQIFSLVRKSNFEQIVWLPITVTIIVLLFGLVLALLIIRGYKRKSIDSYQPVIHAHKDTQIDSLEKFCLLLPPINHTKNHTKSEESAPLSKSNLFQDLLVCTNSGTGSFVITSILGNTGFIGLALVPYFVTKAYWSWIVLYGIAHNILGSYGLGVLIADRYSNSGKESGINWFNQIKSTLFLPSLWAFFCGFISKDIPLPSFIEAAISRGVMFIIPGAFLLIGMQVSVMLKWQNLRLGIVPALLKILVLPGITGLALTLLGFRDDGRLVLVLMSGMPTAFACIVLAETYDLDRNIAVSAILVSTLSFPIFLLIWLNIF